MAWSTMSPISRLVWRLRLNEKGDDGVREDALFLVDTCRMIEAVLGDAEEREIRDEYVKLWLCDLKYLAADAEDILEEYEYHLEQEEEEAAAAASSMMEDENREENHIGGTLLNELLKMLQMICKRFKKSDSREIEGVDEKKKYIQATFLNDLSKSIQEIRKRLDDINVRRKALKLRKNCDNRHQETQRRSLVGHLSNQSINIYGRDDNKKQLVDLLKDNKLLDNVLPNHEKEYVGVVIGLVGVGGIGKTVLAQTLYNDEEINNYFDYKAWVTVSETFDILQITKNILESLTNKTSNLTQLSVIQQELASLLQGKFFLVLDDIWEEEKLNGLRFLLQMGSVGSKILITTRIIQVVKAMQPSITFELGPLSEKDGWELFHRHAFKGKGEDQLSSDLVKIGKEIVKKCKSLPLLLKVIGDDLQEAGTNKNRWMEILNHETWENKDDSGNNKVMKILKLSYVRLSRRLKQCFLYCSIFPKDYKFDKDELFQLWAAHGLIETEGSRQVRDIGEGCLYGLLRRSFIQSFIHKDSWNTRRATMTFSLHDIMHDLAQYILDSEQSLTKDRASILQLHHTSMTGTSQTLRHLCYKEPIVGRTFFAYYHSFKQVLSFEMLTQHLKRLRVLILKDAFEEGIDSPSFDDQEFVHVLDSIGFLKHLRYLYLNSYFLPDSLCLLRNLQTLVCPKVKQLPQEIRRLKRLQHLIVDAYIFPPGIGELVELQTLKEFRVIDRGDDEWARPSELKDLRRLGGELKISNVNNLNGVEEAKLLGLSSKGNLQRLVLEWDLAEFIEDEYCQRSRLVLGGLMPHDNLEELEIWHYVGARFPNWLGSHSFTSLTIVKLFCCFKCVALPTLGKLPSLMWLMIEHMPCLKCIGEEFYGRSPLDAFPSLEHLSLHRMDGLAEWWGMDKCPFPRLSTLDLSSCPFLCFSISDMDVEYHQPSLNRMFDTVSRIEVFNCPYVKEWCEAHASTTLVKVEILNLS